MAGLKIWLFCLFSAWALAANAAAPDELPREIEINGVELVKVPEGWFWYTVENGPIYDLKPGEPRYRELRIWLDAYYIGKYPARSRDLKRFLDANGTGEWFGERNVGCTMVFDGEGKPALREPERDLPATQLSWHLAEGMALWLGFRLPSEVEWQKAARGTDQRHWPWGDEVPDDTHAGFFNNPGCNPTPVDQYPKGASPYGAMDMAGNAFEWVADWYNAERDKTLKDGERNPPLAERGSVRDDLWSPMKILKGGRWASGFAGISINARSLDRPEVPFLCYGVRFALDVEAAREHLARGTARVLAR